MRKTLHAALAACLTLTLLASCAAAEQLPPNRIEPIELTGDEQDLLYLLTDNQDALLFSYHFADAFRTLLIWLEVYEHGELVQTAPLLDQYRDIPAPMEGKVALLIEPKPEGYRYALSAVSDGSRTAHPGVVAEMAVSTDARGFTSLRQPMAVEHGEAIVLYVSIFGDDGLDVYPLQDYLDHPEYVQGYPYVHILKCMFT